MNNFRAWQIFYGLLIAKKRAANGALFACKELEKIFIKYFSNDQLRVKVFKDRLQFKDRFDFDEEDVLNFQFKKNPPKIDLFFVSLKLAKDDLDLFKGRQTIQQKATYIEKLNERLEKKNEEISKLAKTKSYLMNFIAHEVRKIY